MSTVPLRDAYDVVVIGAGPAGLSAATMTAQAGLATLLLDENASPGGQIWRSVAASPLARREVLGPEYADGAAAVQAARASGAEIVSGATVWSLDAARQIAVSVGGVSRVIGARRVIVATGALERPFPIPGWTLPGVMTAGAAQTLLKSSALVPDGRVVLAGQGPLLWLLAAQILRLGGRIDALLDTANHANRRSALPHAWEFLTSPYFAKGLALLREVKAKLRVVAGVTELAACGAAGRLDSVRYRAGGREVTLPADLLLLHHGVVPNVNLAMAAGVSHRWDSVQLCWVPVLDDDLGSSLDGIAIAGDGGGIGGALAAVARGRIAARAAVAALAPAAAAALPTRESLHAPLRRAMRGRGFLDRLFRPDDAFRLPEGETIVCRCEEVTAQQVREAVAFGAAGPNQMKAYLRCGMGPCQGRMCGLTVAEMIAQARGCPVQEVGYFRLRPPVKPITLAEFAAIPKHATEIGAVERD